MNSTRATLNTAHPKSGRHFLNRYARRWLKGSAPSHLQRMGIRSGWPELAGVSTFLLIGVLAVLLITDRFLIFGLMALGGLLTIYFLGKPRGAVDYQTSNAFPHIQTTSKALGSLAHIAELKDEELGGHSERVAENSVLIGRELGLDRSQLDQLWWAGLLHDLGKIGVAESILRKPGSLTTSEMSEVRNHPEYGARIASAFIEEGSAIADAIRHHHERWDGSGYPYALKGDAIPILARVVAIADVFEALTSHRAYREALSPAQAAMYITREAGSHFDPEVVRVFDICYRSGVLAVASAKPSWSMDASKRTNQPGVI